MEILVGSGVFGIIAGIIIPIIYFFRSKASVAVGWMFLGWAVAGIGGCVGMADLTKQAAADLEKTINKKADELDKILTETNEEIKQRFKKTNS